MAPDLVDQLARMLEITEELVATVRDDQWAAPTPCTEWNVRDLVNHLVAGNGLFAGILTGLITVSDAQGLRGSDQLGDRPVDAYRDVAGAVVAAFARPGALERTVTVAFGTVPGVVAAHLRLTEALVHGWDLAQATGRTVSFPDDVVEQELEFTRGALGRVAADRSPFAPSRPVDDDAPAIDRLAACLGREVTWAR